jgi:hypothetical protein
MCNHKRADANDLAIRVNIGRTIGLNKSIFQTLKRPDYLHFWWGEREKVLAISAADNFSDLAIEIPSYFYSPRSGSGCRLKPVKLMRTLKSLTGWDDSTSHLLIGEYVPGLCMVVFKTAEHDGKGGDGLCQI